MTNQIEKILIDLGIIESNSYSQLHDKVRDSQDIKVNRCNKSGVIFLSRSDHIDKTHYQEMNQYDYWSTEDRNSAITSELADLDRRSNMLKNIIANKTWMDVGTGVGGILDKVSSYSSKTIAVEPQKGARKSLESLGYTVFPSVEEVSVSNIQVVTLFHVFEHLTDPLNTLFEIKSKMESGGRLIIEVPHAKDFLISFLDCEAFKNFTFWSEHLILHTRESLRIFLEKAGFVDVAISGQQRYPLANHLYWLSKGKPGGHIKWDVLSAPNLDDIYEKYISQD